MRTIDVPYFLVREPGPLTLVEDLGRPGHAALGVPPSGALDAPALKLANRLVGNPEGAAGLEIAFGHLIGEFSDGRWFAVTGADLDARLHETPLTPNVPYYAAPGQVLRLGGRRGRGVRAYLAISGGIEVPAALGSRSADLMSGLGPAPLRRDRRLPLGRPSGRLPGVDVAPVGAIVQSPTLEIVPGPRDDWFTPDAVWNHRGPSSGGQSAPSGGLSWANSPCVA
ncbi:hypothetical protein C1I98_02015 [Spongiactinospora gelatinilytica]|uniref:Carboxyltransferase domain-containing protein n=1 Tax=Spongiactinospora gelatinilytica TaxID=2666298 RepID=A0A2W2J396_9ACTN|nr:hypothetical protein [Spongiactinospora gelatinilytica]PZG56074.1 hypothetical protein C1I98_02015 [Spongiactinospora gelatinilytica]